MKGRDRNAPCTCGCGLKRKACEVVKHNESQARAEQERAARRAEYEADAIVAMQRRERLIARLDAGLTLGQVGVDPALPGADHTATMHMSSELTEADRKYRVGHVGRHRPTLLVAALSSLVELPPRRG